METRLLITGDIHGNASPKEKYRFDLLSKIPDLLREHNASHLVILGDLTDAKNNHDAKLVNLMVDWLASCAAVARVIVLKGNHDYTDPDQPFFAFLNHIPNIRWISKPTVLKFTLGRFLFLPHTDDHERDWSDIDLRAFPRVFCHNTFAGARNEHGGELKGIPTSIFATNQNVISGDIHTAQRVGKIVRYVGAPYLIDFGDSYNPRMLLIDDHGEYSLPMYGVQKRLIDVPMPAAMQGKPGAFTRGAVKNLDTYGSWGNLKLKSGDIARIRIAVSENDHKHWPEIQKGWRAWAEYRGFVIDSIVPMIERTSAGSLEQPRAHRLNDDETMTRYGKAKQTDTATMATGRKLAQKV